MVGVSTDGQKRANMKRSEDMCPSEPKRLHVCNKQHSSSQSALSAKNGISVVRRMGSRSVLSRREAVYIPPPKPPPPPKVNPLIASSSQARRPLGPLLWDPWMSQRRNQASTAGCMERAMPVASAASTLSCWCQAVSYRPRWTLMLPQTPIPQKTLHE